MLPAAAWYTDLSEDMRTASTGLMMLDDIDESEEVRRWLDPPVRSAGPWSRSC